MNLIGVLVLALSGPAHAGSQPCVSLLVHARAAEARALDETLRELLARIPVDVAEGARCLRADITLPAHGTALVLITDPLTERPLFRRALAPHRARAVLVETAAHVAYNALDGLLRVGAPRQESSPKDPERSPEEGSEAAPDLDMYPTEARPEAPTAPASPPSVRPEGTIATLAGPMLVAQKNALPEATTDLRLDLASVAGAQGSQAAWGLLVGLGWRDRWHLAARGTYPLAAAFGRPPRITYALSASRTLVHGRAVALHVGPVVSTSMWPVRTRTATGPGMGPGMGPGAMGIPTAALRDQRVWAAGLSLGVNVRIVRRVHAFVLGSFTRALTSPAPGLPRDDGVAGPPREDDRPSAWQAQALAGLGLTLLGD